ncbi:MAG: hypothetical protein U0P45_12650 [Acidimicrobiales bacterium]
MELIELLNRHGVHTRYSCEDTASPSGAWKDSPEEKRFYVALDDVEDLRRLLPLLAESDTLVRSITPSLGAPRWEYHLTPHGLGAHSLDFAGSVRLQVSVFIPERHIGPLVSALRDAAGDRTP